MKKRCFDTQKCRNKTVDFDEEVTINEDVLEKLAKFSYLGDVFSSGEVQKAITARISSK